MQLRLLAFYICWAKAPTQTLLSESIIKFRASAYPYNGKEQ